MNESDGIAKSTMYRMKLNGEEIKLVN